MSENPAPTSRAPLMQEAVLRQLQQAGLISDVVAKGVAGGYVLQFRMGDAVATLASSRGGARVFASLETVVALLRRLGRARFEVDASQFEAGRVRAPRPDRSMALKATKNVARKKTK